MGVKFSVVVPVYNEEGNLVRLDKEIKSVMKTLGSYEIIYVNDGSDDNSLKVLKSLKNVNIIDLQRNYGQSIALDAGFKAASGSFIISLDSDLQNDPSDIPRMYSYLIKNKLDVVAGWRVKRKDALYIRAYTKIARFVRGFLIRDVVHDEGCTLRVYRSKAIKSIELWGQMHRYIVALLNWKGFKIGELKVNHRPRYSGKTKYGPLKLVNGFTDLIYVWFFNKYSRRPLHLFGALSYLLFFLGLVFEAHSFYLWAFYNRDVSSNGVFILGFFLIVMGLVLFVSGLMMDLLIRNHHNTSGIEKQYLIKETIKK